MDDLDVIAERRAQLKMFLEESRLNRMLANHLLDALRDARAAQAKADNFVASIMEEGERKPYSAAQWRLLMDGIRDEISAAIARASLAEPQGTA